MPKIKTFTVKASVKSGKEGLYVDVDKESMKEDPEIPPFQFEDKEISKYAQEVAEFNNVEQSSILEMAKQDNLADPDYSISFKLIV